MKFSKVMKRTGAAALAAVLALGGSLPADSVQASPEDGEVAEAPVDGLIAYYTFDELLEDGTGFPNLATAEDKWADAIIKTTDAANTKAVTMEKDGVSGNYAKFPNNNKDGTESSKKYYLEVADTFVPNTDPITFSFWINPDTVDSTNSDKRAQSIFHLSADRPSVTYYPCIADGNANKINSFATDDDSYSSGTVRPEEWHHVTVTLNPEASPKEIKFYIDGMESGEGTGNSFTNGGNNTCLYIGRHRQDANPNFIGGLDNIRIYNKVLTTEEISSIYEAERPKTVTAAASEEVGDAVSVVTAENPEEDLNGQPVPNGTEVIFKASEVDSYIFKGWYQSAADDAELVSPEAEYSTTITADTSLYAQYAGAYTVTVSVEPEDGGEIKITDGDGQSIEVGTPIEIGTDVTLTAVPAEGYRVVSFEVSDNSLGGDDFGDFDEPEESSSEDPIGVENPITIDSSAYEPGTEISCTAVFEVDMAELQALYDELDNMLNGDQNLYTEESRDKAAWAYANAYLLIESGTATVEQVKEAVASLNEAIAQMVRQYKLTITGAETVEGGVQDESLSGIYYSPLVEKMVVKASLQDEGGLDFAYWEMTVNGKDAKPVCYTPTYKFYVIGDAQLTAVYQEGEVEPNVSIITTGTYNKATKKATFTVKRSLPLEGYTVVSHGVVLTDQEGIDQYYPSKDFDIDSKNRIKTAKGTTKGLNGTYSASMSCSRNTKWYAKGYVTYTYEGENGSETYTEYSDICEVTVNGF